MTTLQTPPAVRFDHVSISVADQIARVKPHSFGPQGGTLAERSDR